MKHWQNEVDLGINVHAYFEYDDGEETFIARKQLIESAEQMGYVVVEKYDGHVVHVILMKKPF